MHASCRHVKPLEYHIIINKNAQVMNVVVWPEPKNTYAKENFVLEHTASKTTTLIAPTGLVQTQGKVC